MTMTTTTTATAMTMARLARAAVYGISRGRRCNDIVDLEGWLRRRGRRARRLMG
jgi:hypothetical protein